MSRLFSSEGMTTAKWMQIEPQEIRVVDIRPSQAYANIAVLRDMMIGRYRESYSKDIYPHVVKQDGIYWLEDGHHRYLVNLIQEKEFILVRILDNDASYISG